MTSDDADVETLRARLEDSQRERAKLANQLRYERRQNRRLRSALREITEVIETARSTLAEHSLPTEPAQRSVETVPHDRDEMPPGAFQVVGEGDDEDGDDEDSDDE